MEAWVCSFGILGGFTHPFQFWRNGGWYKSMINTLRCSFFLLSLVLAIFQSLKPFLSLENFIIRFNIDTVIMMHWAWEIFMRLSSRRSLWFEWSWLLDISCYWSIVLLLGFLSSRNARFWHPWIWLLLYSDWVFWIKVECLSCVVRWYLCCVHTHWFWFEWGNRVQGLVLSLDYWLWLVLWGCEICFDRLLKFLLKISKQVFLHISDVIISWHQKCWDSDNRSWLHFFLLSSQISIFFVDKV